MMGLAAKYSLLAWIGLPVVGLIVVAGCSRNAPTIAGPAPTITATAPPIASPVKDSNDSGYVGSEACGKCHPGEWNSNRFTHHAKTFRPMTLSALGTLAPRPARFKDTTCAVAISGDQYVLRNPETGQTRPLQFALGSGKQGMTFIAIEDTDIFEMRKTYSPRIAQWYPTPGQEQGDNDPNFLGKMWRGDDARSCILCHAVTIPTDGLVPDPKFSGVGCEACHGPGSAHIAAVNAPAQDGKSDLRMAHMSAWGGKQIDDLCAKCHRSSADVAELPAKQRRTQRFMVYGLELSRCFQQSKDRLTCITCHDPHKDARTDAGSYERICLSCHSNTSGVNASGMMAAPHTATHETAMQIVACPINPRNGCIACHMPKRSLFTDNGNKIPVSMADHFIHVDHKDRTAHPK